MSYAPLRYRQVHLDFHTSEAIQAVGADFDPDAFARTLSAASVNQVTLFGRGHHGWCYYPSEFGPRHPHLVRPDLLGDQIAACRSQGIETFVYNTVQWDEYTARTHPEWRVMTGDGAVHAPSPGDRSTSGQLSATWHPICLGNPGYVEYVIATSLEQIERYAPTGVFLDILLDWQCVCPRCVARMERDGRNPDVTQDRLANDRDVIMDFYAAAERAIHDSHPDVRVFFNSGHIYRGDRARYRYFSHLELESLPTGGWGYDHFPMSVTYAATLGMEYVGMTGKFHTLWGEFGGYKTAAALEYECAIMVAHGAACSIGDQIHPRGVLEADTYKRIGTAYRRVARLEPYLHKSTLMADVAVLSSEALNPAPVTRDGRTVVSDAGVCRMLLQLHLPFHLIDRDADLAGYRVVIVPDDVPLTATDVERLRNFSDRGGTVILSGNTPFAPDGTSQFPLGITSSVDERPWHPDYLRVRPQYREALAGIPDSCHVVYRRIRSITMEGESATVIADAVSPYFNRDWRHFCSHQHAPPNLNPMSDPHADWSSDSQPDISPAIIRSGSYVYFAWPIFSDYFDTGQPIMRAWLANALQIAGYSAPIRTAMPTAGKITVTEQWLESGPRTVVHLVYGPSQLRGNGVRYPEGHVLPVEIIDDVPPLHDIEVRIRLRQEPSRVHVVMGDEELPWRRVGEEFIFAVPRIEVHEAIAIEGTTIDWNGDVQ